MLCVSNVSIYPYVYIHPFTFISIFIVFLESLLLIVFTLRCEIL